MRLFTVALVAFTILPLAALAQDAAPAAPADPAPPAIDAAFDANFQCPETLPDNDSRIEEYSAWTAWAKANHPDWTFKKRLDVRYGLLRHHACQMTLAAIANAEKPAFGP